MTDFCEGCIYDIPDGCAHPERETDEFFWMRLDTCRTVAEVKETVAEVKELVEALANIMSLPMAIDANDWATIHLYPGLLRAARAALAKFGETT